MSNRSFAKRDTARNSTRRDKATTIARRQARTLKYAQHNTSVTR